jgi:ribonuclease P protein component
MLPAAHRMRRRTDFAAAIRGGRRAGRPTLVLHLNRPAGDAPAPSPALVGFVVSKAVGPATVRNQVKRRLRALVRERLDRLPAGTVVAVRALPASAQASFQDLGRDLDAALERLAPDARVRR